MRRHEKSFRIDDINDEVNKNESRHTSHKEKNHRSKQFTWGGVKDIHLNDSSDLNFAPAGMGQGDDPDDHSRADLRLDEIFNVERAKTEIQGYASGMDTKRNSRFTDDASLGSEFIQGEARLQRRFTRRALIGICVILATCGIYVMFFPLSDTNSFGKVALAVRGFPFTANPQDGKEDNIPETERMHSRDFEPIGPHPYPSSGPYNRVLPFTVRHTLADITLPQNRAKETPLLFYIPLVGQVPKNVLMECSQLVGAVGSGRNSEWEGQVSISRMFSGVTLPRFCCVCSRIVDSSPLSLVNDRDAVI